MKTYIVFVIALFISIAARSQVDKTWSYLFNVKNHDFYDSGVYELGNTNQATAYGLGIQAQRRLSKRIGWSFGYSLALADSIKADEGWTRNAIYHQLEGNITLQPKNYKRIKPYLFSGYAYSFLPQLSKISERGTGANINVGGGIEVKLEERIGIAYQSTYGYSLVDDIPYNFRHQFGVVLCPSRFKKRTPHHTSIAPNDPVNVDSLHTLIDSLQIVIDSVSHLYAKTKDSSLDITTISNNPSDAKMSRLNQYKQLNSHSLSNNPIRLKTFEEYTLILSDERLISVNCAPLSPGYYLMHDSLTTLREARRLGSEDMYASLGAINYLNKGDKFTVLCFVGADRTEALEKANTAKQKGMEVLLVRIP